MLPSYRIYNKNNSHSIMYYLCLLIVPCIIFHSETQYLTKISYYNEISKDQSKGGNSLFFTGELSFENSTHTVFNNLKLDSSLFNSLKFNNGIYPKNVSGFGELIDGILKIPSINGKSFGILKDGIYTKDDLLDIYKNANMFHAYLFRVLFAFWFIFGFSNHIGKFKDSIQEYVFYTYSPLSVIFLFDFLIMKVYDINIEYDESNMIIIIFCLIITTMSYFW